MAALNLEINEDDLHHEKPQNKITHSPKKKTVARVASTISVVEIQPHPDAKLKATPSKALPNDPELLTAALAKKN